MVVEDISINENRYFYGSENDIEMDVIHELAFDCHFNLENYPFDMQLCSIKIAVPTEIYRFVKAIPGNVTYLGVEQLVQFTVSSMTSTVKSQHGHDFVVFEFILRRTPTYVLNTYFIPCIGLVIMANLTVLACSLLPG